MAAFEFLPEPQVFLLFVAIPFVVRRVRPAHPLS